MNNTMTRPPLAVGLKDVSHCELILRGRRRVWLTIAGGPGLIQQGVVTRLPILEG